jgi:hypothetical protein
VQGYIDHGPDKAFGYVERSVPDSMSHIVQDGFTRITESDETFERGHRL